MADPDYSRDFVVYLTRESGIRFLTNPSWIALADQLAGSPRTISELTQATGMPRSTVQSGLRRMSDLGLLASGRSGDDARKVLHRLAAVPVMRSVPPSHEMDGFRMAAVRSLIERRGLPAYDSMFILVAEVLSRGIDLRPVFTEVGYSLGTMYATHEDRDRGESLEDVLARLFQLEGPVRVSVTEERVSIDAGPMPVPIPNRLIMGFVQAVLQADRGVVSCPVMEADTVPDGRRCRLSSRVCFRGPPEAGPRLIRRWSADSFVAGDPFTIHLTDKGAVLVSSDTMNAVLEALGERESTVADLSVGTGMPPATVQSALARLEESGAVTSRRPFGATVYSSSAMSLTSFSPSAGGSGPVPGEGWFPETPLQFRYAVYRYMMWMVGVFGLGGIPLSRTVGATIARDAVSIYGIGGAQEFVDTVCRVHSARGVDLRLESYIPIAISYRPRDGSLENSEAMVAYLKSLVEEGVRITSGHVYPVRIDVVRDPAG